MSYLLSQRRVVWIAWLLSVALGPACSSPPSADDIRICGASSLRHVLPDALPGVDLHTVKSIRFDATSRLARQIAQGAPCTLFFAADPRWVDWLEQRSSITKKRVMQEWRNHLVVLLRPGLERTVTNVKDLANLSRVAIAHPDVPLGSATREALEGIPLDSVQHVHARSAAHVVQLVETGVVDAAIAFSSEIPFLRTARLGFELEPHTYTPIQYVGVALTPKTRDILGKLRPGSLISLSRAPVGRDSWMP